MPAKISVPVLSVLFTLLILVTLYSNTYAAPDGAGPKGRCALLFQVGSNFTLQSFNGATLAFKYQMNKRSALRFGVTLNGSSNTDDFNYTFSNPDTMINGNEKRQSYGISITALYLYYNRIIRDVAVYCGGGPLLGLTYSRDNQLYATNNQPNRDNKSNGYNAGLSFVGGVEWYLTKNISLLGEYGFSAGYNYSINHYNVEMVPANTTYINSFRTEKISGYSFGGSTVRLGVSVYF